LEKAFLCPKRSAVAILQHQLPPIVDKMELADKTIVHYWWKRPDHLLENQLDHITDSNCHRCLETVDFAAGGDHGRGRFWMLF
jgi:hypothetical protein